MQKVAMPAARPILKWVGGKSQLLNDLVRRVPDFRGVYREPFFGGGALFFELFAAGKLEGGTVLSDLNRNLIDVYLGIRDDVDGVISILKRHKYEMDYYYRIRALDPKKLSLTQRAARVIYLNKTCFNGLYRENSTGKFNVPFGKHKRPNFCDEANLRLAAEVLSAVEIENEDFEQSVNRSEAGDFVYFDPPYHPVSTTSNFTAYSQKGFNQADQIRLRDLMKALTKKGVSVMLSNSDTPFIRELYKDFKIESVRASRSVNCKGTSRGKVSEVIVRN